MPEPEKQSANKHHVMRYVNRAYRCGKLYRIQALGALGLEGSDQTFLLNLCHHPGISQEQLAKTIYIDKSMVARKLASLEKKGYCFRTPDENDKRILRVYPTEKAQNCLPEVTVTLENWNRILTRGLTPEEIETLEALLIRVADNATAWVDNADR